MYLYLGGPSPHISLTRNMALFLDTIPTLVWSRCHPDINIVPRLGARTMRPFGWVLHYPGELRDLGSVLILEHFPPV